MIMAEKRFEDIEESAKKQDFVGQYQDEAEESTASYHL